MSNDPRIESTISSAIVHQTPIGWPTWMITASSAIGTTMKRDEQEQGHVAKATPAGCARGAARWAPASSAAAGAGALTRPHGRQPVQADELDQRADVRLGMRSDSVRPARAAAGEHGEVDHQRRVGEAQLGQVDDDVARRGSAARAAGGAACSWCGPRLP